MFKTNVGVQALFEARAEFKKLVDEKHPELSWYQKDRWITGMLRRDVSEQTTVLFGDDGYPIVKDGVVQTIF